MIRVCPKISEYIPLPITLLSFSDVAKNRINTTYQM